MSPSLSQAGEQLRSRWRSKLRLAHVGNRHTKRSKALRKLFRRQATRLGVCLLWFDHENTQFTNSCWQLIFTINIAPVCTNVKTTLAVIRRFNQSATSSSQRIWQPSKGFLPEGR